MIVLFVYFWVIHFQKHFYDVIELSLYFALLFIFIAYCVRLVMMISVLSHCDSSSSLTLYPLLDQKMFGHLYALTDAFNLIKPIKNAKSIKIISVDLVKLVQPTFLFESAFGLKKYVVTA